MTENKLYKIYYRGIWLATLVSTKKPTRKESLEITGMEKELKLKDITVKKIFMKEEE